MHGNKDCAELTQCMETRHKCVVLGGSFFIINSRNLAKHSNSIITYCLCYVFHCLGRNGFGVVSSLLYFLSLEKSKKREDNYS